METNTDQHWSREWLVVGWNQAIVLSNVDFSLMQFCGIHPRAISQPVPQLLFCIMSLIIWIIDKSSRDKELTSELWGVCCEYVITYPFPSWLLLANKSTDFILKNYPSNVVPVILTQEHYDQEHVIKLRLIPSWNKKNMQLCYILEWRWWS